MAGRIINARRARHFRERPDLLNALSDRELIEKYRLSRYLIWVVYDLIVDDIKPHTERSHPISAMTKLLITLQFLAKAEFYSEGGLTHGVSKSSVCRSIWQVIAAVNERLKNITFPSSDVAIAQVKQRFYQIANIPNCVGAVDGTLVPIIAPKVREDLYVCRKGYHSMNAQAVVDANMRFIDVVAQWPGSTHDNTIFENCGLKRWMENRGNCWLVGDSGYALKPYLLTPKPIPRPPAETAYNLAHSRTRMVVERAFGLLKSRFRCLHKTGGCLQFTPEKSALIFVVCAKLHNLCLDGGMELVDELPPDLDDDDFNDQFDDVNHNAQRIRDAIINRF